MAHRVPSINALHVVSLASAAVDKHAGLAFLLRALEEQMLALKKLLTLPADVLMLAGQKNLRVAYGNLRTAQSLDLTLLLSPRDEWPTIVAELAALNERDQDAPWARGAINQGDRRAIYGLIRALKPATLLEIGTHVGSSTLHIAAALRANARDGRPGKLTTVDVIDVNAENGPWARTGMRRSPRQMVDLLGMGEHVSFRVADSIDFLKNCHDT
jgi:hypothetical protein